MARGIDFDRTEAEAALRAHGPAAGNDGVTVVAQMFDGDHMDWDDGAGWVMFGTMAVFWLAVLALGVWAVASHNRRHQPPPSSPLDIVRLRYARGEISAEEFERMKRDLG